MLEVELSDQARADLSEIFTYTIETWSERRAILYLEAINAVWQTLAENPGLGRDRGDMREGLRSYPTERHVSYFEIEGDTLTIIRILHTAQDPDAAFPPTPTP